MPSSTRPASAQASEESPYDLALPAADFTPWNGPPRRSIVLCTHPRSGSTLIGEAMRLAGGLGCPLEYLHRGFRPRLAERWRARDLHGYVDALHRHRTESNGVLSIKLFWQDIEEVAHERGPNRFPPPGALSPEETTDQNYRDLSTLVRDLLPHPEFAYLERQDRVRQAVSAIVASQTRLWRSIPGVGRQEAAAAPRYDYDRIAGMIAFADYSHSHWRRFFAVNGVTPYRLTYEDLSADFEGTSARLCAMLGATSVPRTLRMRRQANTTSEAMVLRFLRDHAQRQDRLGAPEKPLVQHDLNELSDLATAVGGVDCEPLNQCARDRLERQGRFEQVPDARPGLVQQKEESTIDAENDNLA